MSKNIITATEVRNNFFNLVDLVANTGEPVYIKKDKEVKAKLTPVNDEINERADKAKAWLERTRGMWADRTEEAISNKSKVCLPGIVFTEINSGQDSKNELKLKEVNELTEIFEFIPADKDIYQKAGFLIRDTKHLKLADAIVAATALSLKAKLATRNRKDFEDIKGLKLYKN